MQPLGWRGGRRDPGKISDLCAECHEPTGDLIAAHAIGRVFGFKRAEVVADPELAAGLVLLAQGCKGASKGAAIIEAVARWFFKKG